MFLRVVKEIYNHEKNGPWIRNPERHFLSFEDSYGMFATDMFQISSQLLWWEAILCFYIIVPLIHLSLTNLT